MSDQRQTVLDALERCGISYELQEHPAVHTIEEMDALGVFERGEVCKNLFLRNANGKTHYLVSLCKTKHPDIQSCIKPQLGSSRLSFGSPVFPSARPSGCRRISAFRPARCLPSAC